MKNNYSFLFVITLFFVCGLNALEFKNCGSSAGSFSRIDVSNCDVDKNATSCILKKNTNATISIDFTPTKDNIQNVTAEVHGTILGMKVPFPLPESNGCESGIQCPLKKGQLYLYQTTLPVLKTYPKVKVLVKWELKDESGEKIVCVEIPAKIEQ